MAENAGGGFDTVFTTANSAVANPNVEALRFIGSGAFTGFAAATGTSILGGGGADHLYGAAGSDTLDGGAGGADVLKGGAGADDFIVRPDDGGGVGVRIVDFTPGADHVELDVNTYYPGTQEPEDNGFVVVDDRAFLAESLNGSGLHGIYGLPFFYDSASGDLYNTTEVYDPNAFLGFDVVPNRVIAHFDNHPTPATTTSSSAPRAEVGAGGSDAVGR